MVSSTFDDLKDHRQALKNVILDQSFTPIIMEHSGAQDSDIITKSLQMVDDCAAYVLLISHRYGHVPSDPRNPRGLSITELEFDRAVLLGRPRLLFVMHEDHPVPKAGWERDPDKEDKLEKFKSRAKLKDPGDPASNVMRIYDEFTTVAELGTKFANALARLAPKLNQPLSAPAPLPAPARGSGWRRLTTQDFAPPPDSATVEDIRKFLQGAQHPPMWIARHGSVQRTSEVAQLMHLAGDSPAVIIHGPVGQGKSTLARQLVAAWLATGRAAFAIGDRRALSDPALIGTATAAGRCLLLLDDVRLLEDLPLWCAWVEEPAVTVIQTIQSRHMSDQAKLHNQPRIYEVRPPRDPAPFIELLTTSRAALHDDVDELSRRFVAGLKEMNHAGGLWTAMWEATRGQALDSRIDTIVEEFFGDPARSADAYALAGVTFLNTVLVYSDQDPDYSRFTLDPRRSLLARLIANHPALAPDLIAAATGALARLGRLLVGEFVRDGSLGDRLDHEADPTIEFRSGAVTHAFNRWIFGALSETRGSSRLSRWEWFEALFQTLRTGAEPLPMHDYIGLLRALGDAWMIWSNLVTRYDHFRSGANLAELGKNLYDLAVLNHPAPADQSRLDFQLSRVFDIAAQWLDARGRSEDVARIADLRDRSRDRLLAATVPSAPNDILISVADRLSDNSKSRIDYPDSDWEGLIRRILNQSISAGAKDGARYLRFKWYCVRHHAIGFARLQKLAEQTLPEFIERDYRFIDIVHAYLKVSQSTRNAQQADAFYRGGCVGHPLSSMAGIYRLVVRVMGRNEGVLRRLTRATERLGHSPHKPNDNILHGLAQVIRCAGDERVPFEAQFGHGPANGLRRVRKQLQAGDYSGVRGWLVQSALALRDLAEAPLVPANRAPLQSRHRTASAKERR